jgi:acyl-CoA thioesterase-1
MTDAQLEKLVRFQDPERSLGYVRTMDDQTRATLFGTTESELQAVERELAERKRVAVEHLGARPDVRAALAAVPLRSGQTIVALGESSTADRLSWFELLAGLLAAGRPDLDLNVRNLSVSGATTTQTLAGIGQVARTGADWILCMLGGNDARRFDSAGGPRLVSEAETERNLRLIRRRVGGGRDVRWVWLTPTPVDEAKIAAYPYFAGVTWTNRDVSALAAVLGRSGDLVVNSGPSVGVDEPYLEDGLHTTLAAQANLAVHVLAALAGASR